MLLVHDDDLAQPWAQLRGIYDSTVSSTLDNTLAIHHCIDVFLLKAPDALQSEAALGRIRNLKPTVHNARISELFRYLNLSVTHSEGAHRKDLSPTGNGASDHTPYTCVATLSEIFHSHCESHIFQKLDSRSSLLVAPPLATSPSRFQKNLIRSSQRTAQGMSHFHCESSSCDTYGCPPSPAPSPEP